MRPHRRRVALVAAAFAACCAVAPLPAAAQTDSSSPSTAPACTPGGAPVELTGALVPADARTYEELPVQVEPGTTRIEVGYSWASNGPDSTTDQTVVDLGLWDEKGTDGPAGFRGWSGSRQGRTDKGQAPIFVQADSAERGYVPGSIDPGTWSVEVGFGAVHSTGATWHVTVRCLNPTTGPVWTPDPVDPSYVARPAAGWYRADLHLHAYHSSPKGPTPAEMVADARRAKLDVVPVTEYVTDAHWGMLGATQRDNPDLLIWPGREVITYFGHSIVLGETPSTLDYRQGYGSVDLGDIQRKAVGDGAVFQVAHPTIFPGDALRAFCRGCEFQLGDHIDWDLVDDIEVVTGPAVIDPATQDVPEPGVTGIANPFVATAVDLWESLLQQGHRITGVSGSDDKSGDEYGITATMIHADSLSRAALTDALRAGHAYVQVFGADKSPTMDIDAHTADGKHASFGDTLVGTAATMDVTVDAAAGQSLVVSRDGTEVQRIPITSDAFTTSIAMDRDAAEGPLGTFWRVDVANDIQLSAIGNPVFLADAPPPPKQRGAVPTAAPVIPNFPVAAAASTTTTASASSDGSSSSSGVLIGVVVAVLVVGGAVVAFSVARRRRAPR